MSVVNGLWDAVHREDWARAAGYFCADFQQKHKKELLDGSLLRHDPHVGKQTPQVVFAGPVGKVDRCACAGRPSVGRLPDR